MSNQDRISEVYKGEIWAKASGDRARRRIDWLCDQASGATLDIGCSQGIAALLLARRGLNVCGVDVEFDRLEYAARDRAAEPHEVGERAQFTAASGERLPFRDHSFDSVLMGEVLEHAERPAGLVAEALRALRPHGLLIVTVPFGYSPHHDHHRTFYHASLSELVAGSFAIRSMDVVEGYLRLVTVAGTVAGLPTDMARRMEAEFLPHERALHDGRIAARAEADRLRGEVEQLRSEAEALHARARGLEEDAASLRGRLQAAQATASEQGMRLRAAELRSAQDARRADDAQRQIMTMRRRKFWRAGAAVAAARRDRTLAAGLPARLVQIARTPSSPPPAPRGAPSASTPPAPSPPAPLPAPTPPSPPAAPTPSAALAAQRPLTIPEPPPVRIRVARPDLTVAVILDEESSAAFAHEFRALHVGRDDWQAVLQRDPPAFLFVEVAWRGNNGRWGPTVSADVAVGPLEELVGWCRDQGIPSVFWAAEDPTTYERSLDTARLFDHVLTSDAGSVERYRADLEHDRVGVLPHGVQPRTHNPTRATWRATRGVAFAGSADDGGGPGWERQVHEVLDPARAFDLELLSPGEGDPRDQWPDRFFEHLAGSVPPERMAAAYKLYRVFLNVNEVSTSPTMCSRRVFEVLGSGTPLVSGPSAAFAQLLDDAGIGVTDDAASTTALLRILLGNEELRDRQAVRGLRAVHAAHTCGHRVDGLIELLGLGAPLLPDLVSMVVPVDRDEQLHAVVANAARQGYDHAELVVVTGPGLSEDHVLTLAHEAGVERVRAIVVAAGASAGTRLHSGYEVAAGSRIALMDPRDFYGPHYLTDAVNAFRYTDAGIVGKLSHYGYLSGPKYLALRNPGKEYRSVGSLLPATLVVDREVIASFPFTDGAGSGRAAFMRRARDAGVALYAVDRFNYVQVRDVTSRVEEDDFLRLATMAAFGRNFNHVIA